MGKLIGQGAYAIVKEVIHKKNKERFAVKIYDRSKLKDPQRQN